MYVSEPSRYAFTLRTGEWDLALLYLLDSLTFFGLLLTISTQSWRHSLSYSVWNSRATNNAERRMVNTNKYDPRVDRKSTLYSSYFVEPMVHSKKVSDATVTFTFGACSWLLLARSIFVQSDWNVRDERWICVRNYTISAESPESMTRVIYLCKMVDKLMRT